MKDIVVKNCRIGHMGDSEKKAQEPAVGADTIFSYVRNCVIYPRGDEFLFSMVNDEVVIKLDGYVIMPIEEYRRRHGEPE